MIAECERLGVNKITLEALKVLLQKAVDDGYGEYDFAAIMNAVSAPSQPQPQSQPPK